MMHGLEKSDLAVVAMKPANNAGSPAAEWVEPRAGTKGNADPPRTRRTQSRDSVSQGLERVRQAARQRKRQAFTALLHHVTVDALRDAFLALKRRAAPGVDGVTWQDYEAGLEDRLQDLHTRVHRGTYRALPVRRRFIPKPDGRQRPLGIAALEDKLVQRAVVTVLNAIYEEDFLGFSYGFRPGRGQHDALDALCVAIMRAALGEIKDEMRRRRHDSLTDQGRWLRSVVAGYFAYHAVPTNAQAIGAYRHHVLDLWRRSLKRRSQKARMTWARMDRLAAEWLPPPHVLHPWPEERMAVRYPR